MIGIGRAAHLPKSSLNVPLCLAADTAGGGCAPAMTSNPSRVRNAEICLFPRTSFFRTLLGGWPPTSRS